MSASTDRPFDARPIGLIAASLTGIKLARQTRALLSRGDAPRSGQPVWRNSYYVGQMEDRLWKPINGGSVRDGRRWTGAILKAAKAFELRSRAERREKEPGARNGLLGEVGIAVLEYLYQVVDYATGRLEPAVRTIAAEIGRSYSAVHEALCRLRVHGFLRWMRRSEKIEEPEPGGPQVKQASNAYCLMVPEALQGWLARTFGKAPLSGCEKTRIEQRKRDLEDMLSKMTCTEYHEAHNYDLEPVLGDTLRSIAAALDAQAKSANPAGAMKSGDHSDP